jgi:hypothetical protein
MHRREHTLRLYERTGAFGSAFTDADVRSIKGPLPMDHESTEERIRNKAYELWLADGEMEGCADEYWRQARETVEKEIASESSDGESDSGPAR